LPLSYDSPVIPMTTNARTIARNESGVYLFDGSEEVRAGEVSSNADAELIRLAEGPHSRIFLQGGVT